MLYLDTGCLVKLYYPEPESAAVARIVEGRRILFAGLHELEMTTAMQLKVFRGEAKAETAKAALDLVREDLANGILVRRRVDMKLAMDDAVSLSLAHAAAIGCRSLDIVHCALARSADAATFVSTDARQVALARAISLKVVTI